MNELKLLKGKKFHFIGIGGISMSALALMLKKGGCYVQGSDDVINSEVKKLAKRKVKVFIGHSRNNVLNADVIVYSSAIHDDNPELEYARKNKLIILKRAELLGLIAETYKVVIAVAGSHGKTTTTAMISEIFESAGMKPTVHIGGKLRSIRSNYKIGNKQYFITENCEYKDNFLFLKPDISIILNIDSDHLDYFKNLENLKHSFFRYAGQTRKDGVNIVCDQDVNLKDIANLENSVLFGLNKKSDIYARNIREYKSGYFSFDVVFENFLLGNIRLNIIGIHNVLNALVSVFVAMICEIDFNDIKRSIENFSGVERRSEFIGEYNGAKIFHDYAHHPKQIEKMIQVANELKSNEGKVITIFEPHTFSRTKFLLREFAESFSKSDSVYLLPVYSAREQECDGLNSKDLLKELRRYVKNSECFNDYNDVVKRVKNGCKKGDVVLILGAGTIEKVGRIIFE